MTPSPSLPTRCERRSLLPLRPDVSLVDVRLAAEAPELTGARALVRGAAVDFGFDSGAAYEFVYAVNEALTNAIKHGQPDPDGMIGLRIEADGDALICSVRDRGPFVPPAAPAEPGTAEGGRGFAFMSALTDDLELTVEPDGTTVRLVKHLSAAAAAFRA